MQNNSTDSLRDRIRLSGYFVLNLFTTFTTHYDREYVRVIRSIIGQYGHNGRHWGEGWKLNSKGVWVTVKPSIYNLAFVGHPMNTPCFFLYRKVYKYHLVIFSLNALTPCHPTTHTQPSLMRPLMPQLYCVVTCDGTQAYDKDGLTNLPNTI